MTDPENIDQGYIEMVKSWKGMGDVMRKSVTYGQKKGDLEPEVFLDIATAALNDFRRSSSKQIERLLLAGRGADAGGVMLLVEFGTQKLARRMQVLQRVPKKKGRK